MKVGINGFGRIGKNVYKILVSNGIDVPLVNDPNIDLKYMKYLLEYDSVCGRNSNVHIDDECVIFNSVRTKLSNKKDPSLIEWQNEEIDVVIEATGLFLTKEMASKHDAKLVILTAVSPDVPMFVYGVNHMDYDEQNIISGASCTTNCLAPLAKVLHSEFGIVEGMMSTVHAVTPTQSTTDRIGPKKRSARSCFNIIPASTGAAKALGRVIPDLEGKIDGMAFRVPVINGSVVDLVVKTEKETSLEKIKEAILLRRDNMRDIIEISEDEIVSSDIIGHSSSCILDLNASIQLSPTCFKLIAWYDNEHGYSCRIVDLLVYIKQRNIGVSEKETENLSKESTQ